MLKVITLLIFVACISGVSTTCLVDCPPPTGIGHCANLCGRGCKKGRMCCSNGCGQVCMKPITTCHAPPRDTPDQL